MKKNVGNADKWIRIVLGVVVLSLLVLDGNVLWVGLLGFIPLITGLINFCPLYLLFGVNTNKTK
jgi:hypothetical protein